MKQGHIVFQLCSKEIVYANIETPSQYMTHLQTLVKPAAITVWYGFPVILYINPIKYSTRNTADSGYYKIIHSVSFFFFFAVLF